MSIVRLPFLCLALAVCSLIISVAPAASFSQEKDWPQWRGPNRDGKSLEQGIRTDWRQNPPEHLWTAEGLGEGYGSVSIADGMIFSMGNVNNQQVVTASKLDGGEVVWQTPVTRSKPEHDYSGSRSTPTYAEGKLYVVPSNGSIVCLDAKTGKVHWNRDFSDWQGRMMSVWGYSESPLVDGNFVLCTPGGPQAAIVKLDRRTGKEVWRCAIPRGGDGKNIQGKDLQKGAAYSSIVKQKVGKVDQYVQLVGEGVIGVRADDGKLLWGYEDVSNDVAAIPTPIVGDDFVFASSGYGTGSCRLDLKASGKNVSAKLNYFLRSNQFENHHGGMVLHDGYVYAGHGHNKGFPICVRVSDGKIMWNERGPGAGSAAVLMVDDHLIFRYQNGLLALVEVNPQVYKEKGTFKPVVQQGESWAHPVVLDGKLYLREQNSIMCYDLAK